MNWLQHAVSLAGCAGQLALALVALRRSTQSRLAIPLLLLFLDVFAWNLASLLERMFGEAAWGWLDHTASALTAPLALEFVLAFVGQRRRFARLRILVWIPFVCLSMIPTLGLASPLARDWNLSGPWAAALAICSIPAMSLAIGLLLWHLRNASDSREQARARLLVAAAALGTALGMTDLLANFLPGIPSLGALGFLAAGALTLYAATREKLLDSELTLESAVTALAISGAGVVACLALFRLTASDAALFALGAALIAIALAAAIHGLARRTAAARAHTLQLATLGRLSAQMAHDLKNPLAALKGAAQFLCEDLSGEAGCERRAEFVGLMLDQIARLESALDDYQRLARVEPLFAQVQINEVVSEVVALHDLAFGKRVPVRAELTEGLPPCRADRALLSNALQNLIRNAFEASAGGGSITVRTGRSADTDAPAVVVRVEDTGAGMDARVREQAFDEFFTTKAGGSGLGLSFVRRVIEAHGGLISLDSQQGRGTVVSMRLPLS